MMIKLFGEDMNARRRRMNPRALEGIGRGYREGRKTAIVLRKRKKKGAGKDTMDSLD